MTTKPDWEYAPSWAKYLAQDKCGTWYWFCDKPTYCDGIWNIHQGGRYPDFCHNPKYELAALPDSGTHTENFDIEERP